DASRPLSAYSIPATIGDPGPDGRVGTGDDGAVFTALNLAPEAVTATPVNLTTNLPNGDSKYYTWEVTATRRHRAGWDLLASFTETWSREMALGTGNDFTPNALINSAGNHDRFKTWQAKINGTVSLPWRVQPLPVVRPQTGTPFARTLVHPLNYGTASIKADPLPARHP